MNISITNPGDWKTICFPVHPDEAHLPASVLNIPLPSGAFVQLVIPLAPKTLAILADVLTACKSALVVVEPEPKAEPEFSI